ncbi:MAG TPA: hypothetical protein PLG33_06360 [Prolixibacteraceae bacterium]|nr:hypothetical protein [Prolixibacteraceae bacterium]
MKEKLVLLTFILLPFSMLGQNERTINNLNNGMPNRISMNVTVAKQTQGATFGEKVSVGLHAAGSYVIFPNKQAFLIAQNKITEMSNAEVAKVNAGLHAAGSAIAQGASLVGGALPGGAIISAAVSKADGGRPIWEIKDATDGFVLPADLADGEYTLTVVVKEKATSGLKDTLKTQVRFGIKVEGRTYKVITAGAFQST